MKNIKNFKIKKYAFYTLGVGLLLLGATNAATPSSRQMVKTPSEDTDSKPSMTAVENNNKNAEDAKAHSQTVKSLSPKNQGTFHALPKADQKRVVKAQQKNGTGHTEIHKILKEDSDSQSKSASNSGVSPAQKSMSKSGNNNG